MRDAERSTDDEHFVADVGFAGVACVSVAGLAAHFAYIRRRVAASVASG
jgi:hypothetical protein